MHETCTVLELSTSTCTNPTLFPYLLPSGFPYLSPTCFTLPRPSRRYLSPSLTPSWLLQDKSWQQHLDLADCWLVYELTAGSDRSGVGSDFLLYFLPPIQLTLTLESWEVGEWVWLDTATVSAYSHLSECVWTLQINKSSHTSELRNVTVGSNLKHSSWHKNVLCWY